MRRELDDLKVDPCEIVMGVGMFLALSFLFFLGGWVIGEKIAGVLK